MNTEAVNSKQMEIAPFKLLGLLMAISWVIIHAIWWKHRDKRSIIQTVMMPTAAFIGLYGLLQVTITRNPLYNRLSPHRTHWPASIHQ